jgi:hypothetical protein
MDLVKISHLRYSRFQSVSHAGRYGNTSKESLNKSCSLVQLKGACVQFGAVVLRDGQIGEKPGLLFVMRDA